jgi:hypothetical protein
MSPTSEVTNDISKYIEGGIESLFYLYGYVIPVSTSLIPEMVGIAFFLRYFNDKIGKMTFWTIVILPPVMLVFGVFAPQILAATQAYVFANSKFTLYRIIATAGWPIGNFVQFYAFLLVARTIR